MRFDIVVSHHGSGVGLFVRDAFPDTPILTYQEYFPPPERELQRTFPPEQRDAESRKAHRVFVSHLLSQFVWTDWSLTPTFWQRSTFPADFHARMSVLHDGIDTDAVGPAAIPAEPLRFPNGAIINPGDELVTYVARNLDTVRGFPTAMRSIKIIQERRPRCQFVLLGGDGIGYGNAPPVGNTWREFMLKETGLDPATVHMGGQVDYSTYLRILRLSKAHIYLTTSFVLSWSLLEAMAAECLVVCSDTPPVQEVVKHGFNGLLADYHDHARVADLVLEALARPDEVNELRREARRTIEKRYALKDVLPLQQDLLRDLAGGYVPPGTAERIAQRNALFEPPQDRTSR
jgi:glycosyltransferase involved in cell wall biosynthesis